MRLLARFETRTEAAERAAFLRAHGIATHLADVTLPRMHRVQGGKAAHSLWVLFESQYDDALALLKNPDHPVEQRLSKAQMNILETEGAEQVRRTLIRWSLIVLAVLGAAALAVILID